MGTVKGCSKRWVGSGAMDVSTLEGTLGLVSLRMTSTRDLGGVLSEITRGLVKDLDAALARIWLLGAGDLCPDCIRAPICQNRTNCLHLVASAGLSERMDGVYRRVPTGALKIGRIAEAREAVCTNDLLGDPRIEDKQWVQREGLASFAGYPLSFRSEIFGVLANIASTPNISERKLSGYPANEARPSLWTHCLSSIRGSPRRSFVHTASRASAIRPILRAPVGTRRYTPSIRSERPALATRCRQFVRF